MFLTFEREKTSVDAVCEFLVFFRSLAKSRYDYRIPTIDVTLKLQSGQFVKLNQFATDEGKISVEFGTPFGGERIKKYFLFKKNFLHFFLCVCYMFFQKQKKKFMLANTTFANEELFFFRERKTPKF